MSRVKHTTVEGETLADIAFQFFGDAAGYLKELYQQNPVVHEYPSELPAGLEIFVDLAQKEEPKIVDTLELW